MPLIKPRVAIAGGGMAGLSLAYYLTKAGYAVRIFEKSSEWGGADASTAWQDIRIERHYHHYFSHDRDVIGLIRELGLGNRLLWTQGSTAVYYGGKIYSLAPLAFLLKFQPLPMIERLRFITGILKIITSKKIQPNDPVLREQSAVEWAEKYFGKKLSDVMWRPLLKSKFGSSYDNISAAFLYGRIYNRVSSRKLNQPKELLGYLEGSSSELIQATVSAIAARGGLLTLGRGVQSIRFNDQGKAVGLIDDQGEFHESDAVVLAVQTPQAAQILSQSTSVPGGLNPEIEQLGAVRYQQVISLIMITKEQFSPYYWMNIADTDKPFPVVVEQTNFVPPSKYGGRRLMYVSTYRDPGDIFYKNSDKEIFNLFVSHLKQMNPQFHEDQTEGYLVSRERFATPVYEKNFERLITPIQSKCPNLFYLNGTQVFPDSRNVNKMVALGKQCLQKIQELNFSESSKHIIPTA